MTLTEKLAALPLYYRTMDETNMPSVQALIISQRDALIVYNEVLCEAIREISKDAAKRPMAHLVGWRALSEAEKVLAACEVNP